jgi:hypothetical protein
MLIGGSAHHLWFLPFLFVVSVIVFVIAQLMHGRPIIERFVFAIALIGGTITALMADDLFRDQYLLDRAWAATPAVLWGIALAAIYRHIPRGVWRSSLVPAVGAVLVLACLPLMVIHWRSHLTENLAGMGVMLIALYDWRSSSIKRLALLGVLAYGVYLSHVMFIEGIQAVAARMGIVRVWWLDLSVFILATCGAVLFTKLISRWHFSRWLVPA